MTQHVEFTLLLISFAWRRASALSSEPASVMLKILHFQKHPQDSLCGFKVKSVNSTINEWTLFLSVLTFFFVYFCQE